MGAITGQGQSFNLPNYVGELFNVTPTDRDWETSILLLLHLYPLLP